MTQNLIDRLTGPTPTDPALVEIRKQLDQAAVNYTANDDYHKFVNLVDDLFAECYKRIDQMRYEYIRIDLFRLMPYGVDADWLHQQPDCEFREDYQCFFILKGSQTHTMAALKYGDIFENQT